MSDERKLVEVLEERIRVLEAHVSPLREINESLSTRVAHLQEKTDSLESENQGWLKIWQRQQIEIAELKARIVQLESPRRAS
jgi:FtsZ-binding cell division protein ZapB